MRLARGWMILIIGSWLAWGGSLLRHSQAADLPLNSALAALQADLERAQNRQSDVQNHLLRNTQRQQEAQEALTQFQHQLANLPDFSLATSLALVQHTFVRLEHLQAEQSARMQAFYRHFYLASLRQHLQSPLNKPQWELWKHWAVQFWSAEQIKMRSLLQQSQDFQVLQTPKPESSQVPPELLQKIQSLQGELLNLQQDRVIYERYLEEVDQEVHRLREQYQKAQQQARLAHNWQSAAGLGAFKHKLLPPMPGKIVQSFRHIDRQKSSVSRFFRGIVFESRQPQNLKAVALGKVVFAQPLQGYRHVVILDHGANSFSVYGQLERLGVQAGEWVAAGSSLGEVAFDATQQSYRAYFEIRWQGQSVDPQEWLVP